MARGTRLIGALAALAAVGLAKSGALDIELSSRDDEPGYMSPDNPWSNDYRPPATSAPAALVRAPFRNCNAARAAGAAPVHRGDPGYGPHLDRDGDGVGCEPYYGR